MQEVVFNFLPYKASANGLSRYAELILGYWPGTIPRQLKLGENGRAHLSSSRALQTKQNSRLMRFLQANALVQHAVPVGRLIAEAQPELIYSPFTDRLFGVKAIPQVITCHDLTPLFFPNSRRAFLRSRFWLPFHIYGAQRVIAISRTVADQLIEFGLPAERIEVVLNGIKSISNPIRSPASNNILVVARHALNKNVQAALEGFACFLALEQHWEGDLVILGSSDRASESLKRQTYELGLADRVCWISDLSAFDFDQLLRSSFCLLSCSLMEGFDYPLLEAQVRGLPTIASDIAVHRELHEQNSLLFKLGDEGQSLGAQLQRLVRDQNLWRELSEEGVVHAEKFSIEQQTQEISQVLQSVITSG